MNLKYPKHHLVNTGPILGCQICNSAKLHIVLDLGHQPLCDSLLTEEALNEPEKTYPLRMIWCGECTGVQIDYCVSGSEVYHPAYPYRSGITKELAIYQENMALSLVKKLDLKPKDLVIDIGSNDGTLLKGFKKAGVKILGVEPTNIAKIANKDGIETVQAFFDIKTSKKIKKRYGLASLITSTNTFAHMQTIGEFIVGAYNLLKEGGVFVNETHYLLDVINGGQFDTIYHEHLRTYSLKSLIKLFDQYDFTVTDVARGDRYGGNIRVYATKGRGKKVNPEVKKLLKTENDFGLGKLETYKTFAERVKKARFEFMDFLYKMKKTGKSIVGNSCPARSSTLLNYYGVDKELLPYLAEQPTSLKLNMYLPGKHIPIVNNQRLLDEQPDYVVILAWHYAKPIMEQLKARGLKSNFIVPLPDFQIIKNSQI
ncbi:methyltransferase [Candidatus Daviesbacteria bacterium RIFCSPHIGHO2_02_FULL_41_10]|uniref:Methyltransferase n=1 Tax=Candidatus Daviesbacteria bacterium RIFCSPHIGHO2_02_FULL_41_10 TaxID=1797774 RepID=A0A1F5JUM2_9BACT|nr:MAG: methyltransferase [Candidatus Daviesbacteria bacterium RIFCSPHIGHO2_02_FULL_41_10]